MIIYFANYPKSLSVPPTSSFGIENDIAISPLQKTAFLNHGSNERLAAEMFYGLSANRGRLTSILSDGMSHAQELFTIILLPGAVGILIIFE